MVIFIFFQIIILIIVGVLTVFLVVDLYAFLKGSPFLPSKQKDLEKIVIELKKTNLPLKRFVDLGCGDGEVVFLFSKKLGIPAFGIDINPLLIFLAKLRKFFMNCKNVEFKVSSFRKYKPKEGDVIYLYHLPNLLNDISNYLAQKVNKKNVFVISYNFKIKHPNFKLLSEVEYFSFKAYFYKIKKI